MAPDKLNFEIGLEYLREGKSFDVGDIRLIPTNNSIEVIGWSNYYSFDFLNKAKAKEELEDVKEIFETLTRDWEDLAKFVQNKSIKYCLAYVAGQGAGIPICVEENGKLKWETKLQE